MPDIKPYVAPLLDELRQIAKGLQEVYQGSNPQRRSFILLLHRLTEMTAKTNPADAEKILLGIMVFELEVILYDRHIKLLNGSEIYSQLITKLNISDTNVLRDTERLIYLQKCYHYVGKYFSDKIFQELKIQQEDFFWEDKDSLLKKMNERLREIWLHDAIHVEKLVYATPELDGLQKNIAKMSREYRQISQAQQGRFFGKDPTRDQLIHFIDFIHFSCQQMYPEQHKKIPKMYHAERNIRRGLILFVLMKIYRNYKCFSPEGGWFTSGSTLFKESLHVMNVKSIDDISAAEKADLLKALEEHIRDIKQSYSFLISAWKEKGCHPVETDQDFFLEKIQKYCAEQEILKHQPQGGVAAAASVVSYAAQSGASYAFHHGAGSIVMRATMGAVATVVGGPTAMAVYIGGTLVLSGLQRMIGEHLISSATSGLFTWLLEKIGQSAGDKVTSALSYHVSNEGLMELRKQIDPADDKIFCEWVNAQLALPENIVSENDKSSIRYVFGLEAGSDLLPLLSSSEPSEAVRLI